MMRIRVQVPRCPVSWAPGPLAQLRPAKLASQWLLFHSWDLARTLLSGPSEESLCSQHCGGWRKQPASAQSLTASAPDSEV